MTSEVKNSDKQNMIPDIRTGQFEGPLDLLCYLIEKNKINIYDIPIEKIADQYIEYLNAMSKMDLEITSEFLVMASTLLMIKSRMLLPSYRTGDQDEEIDPREELVLKILEYKRCRSLADHLRGRHEEYADTIFRMPEPIRSLGIQPVYEQEVFDRDIFFEAARELSERNRVRFFDVSNRIAHMLRREKISIKDKMKMIWEKIGKKTRVFFNELFPSSETTRSDRVTGFLALLEMLKTDILKVEQNGPFDIIAISRNKKASKNAESDFARLISKKKIEEIEYK